MDRRSRGTASAAAGLLLSGCVVAGAVPGASVDRCSTKTGVEADACREWRQKGVVYVKTLSNGDELCLEGGFGDPRGTGPGTDCRTRAKIEDGNLEWFQIRVLESSGTKYSTGEIVKASNLELVDLYLQDHGF